MSTLSQIQTLAALQQHRSQVQQRIKVHEKEFKKKFQELPGELAAASANNFIPRFLRGKVTDTALNGGKHLINKFFVTPDNENTSLVAKTKKSGVIPFVKTVFRMFKK